MKAIVLTRYGPPEVLKLRGLDRPVPKDNELLVKMRATTVTKGDCEVRGMTLPLWIRPLMQAFIGFGKPRGTLIAGSEIAGDVEEVGKDVKNFKPGEAVFGTSGLAFGAAAEYICVPEADQVAIKPEDMSYEEAATVPFGGRDALHFVRIADIKPGEKIIVVGAGGSIGTYAVQLAKHMGAEVTGVDSSDKLDMLREIGADKVIDYTREDFTQNGEQYDVILETVGKSNYDRCVTSLRPGGRYVIANPKLTEMIRAGWTTQDGKQVIVKPANGTIADLEHLKGLIKAGTIRAVIDRAYPLEEMVEAHRYVETGAKLGNVVIRIGE